MNECVYLCVCICVYIYTNLCWCLNISLYVNRSQRLKKEKMGVYLGNYCFVMIIVLVLGAEVRSQSLKNGYYSTSCPKAESIVRSTVESHFDSDPTISPGLLRLHFHDCFVQVSTLLASQSLL